MPAFRFGRVIRLRAVEVEAFIESCRIPVGGLEHLTFTDRDHVPRPRPVSAA